MNEQPPFLTHIPSIAPRNQPACGAAPGWPLVIYFHHVHPEVDHYTALSEELFERALRTLLAEFAPYDPRRLLEPGVRPPSEPSCLVTFDDGYRDNYTRARPILDRFGVRAVFFLVTDRLGEHDPDPRADYLDWEEADALAAEGHVMAAHTQSHPRLDALTRDAAREEIEGSLTVLAQRYGPTHRRLFAYPYGVAAPEGCVPEDVLAFATVRAPAVPWDSAPHSVRRTYLPVQRPDLWPDLARNWRRQWGLQPHVSQ